MAPADGGKKPVMLDLDVLLLGLMGAAFLVTGGALLREPAVARARFLEARAVRDREEALANSARAAEAIRVAEGETERVRSQLLKLQQQASEQQRAVAEIDQTRAQLHSVMEQHKAAEDRVRDLEARLRDAESKHKAAEDRVRDLEARLRDAESKHKAADGKLKEAENKLKEAERKLKAAPAPPPPPDNAALEAAQNKITALERMLEGSRARARELQKELAALKGG